QSKANDLSRFTWLTTSGHPQLVHARIKSFSSKGWPEITIDDLVTSEDIERVKAEARKRLIEDIPNDNSRLLAYRLSLIIGKFPRNIALAVANVDPSIGLAGAALDVLIGAWIEELEGDNCIISP